MSVYHGVTIGDPEPITSGSVSSRVCNCACSRCMAGSCCMEPAPDWTQPTGMWPPSVVTTTGTNITVNSCGPTDHDFAVLDPARLYCRKCGETRTV